MRSQIYFPIQRAKTGEFDAMEALSEGVKSLVLPGFDLPLAPDAKAFDRLQMTVVRELTKSWGTVNEVFLDLSRYDPDLEMPDGTAYVTRLFDTARQAGLKAIPATGPVLERKGTTGNYFKRIADIAKRNGRGVVVRLPYDDLKDVDSLNATVNDVQRLTLVSDEDTDVILDFGPLDHLPVGHKKVAAHVQEVIAGAVGSFGRRRFRALVVCGSSIPRTTGKVPDGEPVRIPNAEFQAWSQSINSAAHRHIRFGDYAARYALQTDKGSGANPPARIHISTPENHLLYVAEGPTYQELAEKVKGTSEFAAQSGAWGRNAVRDAAHGRGVGNAASWVARDTHMHVETMAHAVRDRLVEMGAIAGQITSNEALFDQADLGL